MSSSLVCKSYLENFNACLKLMFSVSMIVTLIACSADDETGNDGDDAGSNTGDGNGTVETPINGESEQGPEGSPKIVGGCVPSDQEIALWEAHNAARAQARSCGDDFFEAAEALDWHCDLAQAAENHSMDMAAQDYFDHTGLDGSTFSDRAREAGYENFPSGENIAAGQRNVESVMSSWLSSPGHCSNIMNNRRNEMGASGVSASGARFGIYWTAVFGRN